MARRQVTLKKGEGDSYTVVELVNMVDPAIGTAMTKKEVAGLLEDKRLTVKVK